MRHASITSGSRTKFILRRQESLQTPSSFCRPADTRLKKKATGGTASALPLIPKQRHFWARLTAATGERRWASDATRNVKLRVHPAAAASRPAGQHGTRWSAGSGDICCARPLQLSRKRTCARAGQLVQIRKDRISFHAFAYLHEQ